jgi:hypothetical protein
MPFRLDEKYGEFRAKIQFTTAAWMPYKIYQACLATGILSNTRYCQLAVCEALARDLGLDYDELVSQLPRPRTVANHLFNPMSDVPPGRKPADGERISRHTRVMIGRPGQGNTDEEVR